MAFSLVPDAQVFDPVQAGIFPGDTTGPTALELGSGELPGDMLHLLNGQAGLGCNLVDSGNALLALEQADNHAVELAVRQSKLIFVDATGDDVKSICRHGFEGFLGYPQDFGNDAFFESLRICFSPSSLPAARCSRPTASRRRRGTT